MEGEVRGMREVKDMRRGGLDMTANTLHELSKSPPSKLRLFR